MAEFSDSGAPEGLWHPGPASDDAEFTNPAAYGLGYEETEIIPVTDGLDGSPYQIHLIGTAETPNVLIEHPIASWERAEPLGKIEGSEWVNPVNDLQTLEDTHWLGGTITTKGVHMLADGRDQHLELFQLPEGYKYVRIVDSTTGQVLTSPDDDKKYSGLSSCSCGTGHNATTVAAVLHGQPIPLEGDKEITGIINLDEGTQTAIKPTGVDLHEPDYISRLRTTARLLPVARELYINAETPVGAIDRAIGMLTIRQDDTKTSGELRVVQYEKDDHAVEGQISLTFDDTGRIGELQIYKQGLLRTLGIRDEVTFNDSERAIVTNLAQQQKVAEALAEALGINDWNGLDLRLTASGLYEAMGQRNFDLTSVLVPRS